MSNSSNPFQRESSDRFEIIEISFVPIFYHHIGNLKIIYLKCT